MSRLKFALFGDSLTQRSFDKNGWGAHLASCYQRKADITLRGYSGYNTRWVLQTLDTNFPLPENGGARFDLVTVWFGANDAALQNGSNGRQHVPLEEYGSNLSIILDRLERLTDSILLITPPVVNEEARKQLALSYDKPKDVKPERTMEEAGKYASAVKLLGQKRQVPVLDLYSALLLHPDWQSLQDDGLHFSEAGQAHVADLVLAKIKNTFPALW